MPEIMIPMEIPEAEIIERPEQSEADVVPRWVYLKANDFEELGFSPGFKGCLAMVRGGRQSGAYTIRRSAGRG